MSLALAAIAIGEIEVATLGPEYRDVGRLTGTQAAGAIGERQGTGGTGIPAAIAAKLVHPDKPVCAVVGDGGFLMTAGELATALRYGLKIVIVLFTDNDLALIRIKQEKKGNPIYGTSVRNRGALGSDSVFGVPLRHAHDATELRRELTAAFSADGPMIVEAVVDSREYDDVVLKKDKP